MGAQQGKENRGSNSSVGSGSHGGKSTKKSKSKDTRISSGAGNIFTEHNGMCFFHFKFYIPLLMYQFIELFFSVSKTFNVCIEQSCMFYINLIYSFVV